LALRNENEAQIMGFAVAKNNDRPRCFADREVVRSCAAAV
jgi:hypothetical protein